MSVSHQELTNIERPGGLAPVWRCISLILVKAGKKTIHEAGH